MPRKKVVKNMAEAVRALGLEVPAAEVARKVGCDVNYVYSIRTKEKVRAKKLKALQKKARAVAKDAKRAEVLAAPPPVHLSAFHRARSIERDSLSRRAPNLGASDVDVDLLFGHGRAEAVTNLVSEMERRFMALLITLGLTRAKQLMVLVENKSEQWLGPVPPPVGSAGGKT